MTVSVTPTNHALALSQTAETHPIPAHDLAQGKLPERKIVLKAQLDPRLPWEIKEEFANCRNKQEEYNLLRKHFRFTSADKLHKFEKNEFYYLLHNGKSYFTRISSTLPISNTITLRFALENKSLKPIETEKLLGFGKNRQLFKLNIRPSDSAIGESNIHHVNSDDTKTVDSDQTPERVY